MKLSNISGYAVAAGLAFSLLTVGCSDRGRTAADRSSGSPGYADRNTTASADDKDFAVKAAQGGMAEVQMGNLAQQNASSDPVKALGRRLVEDHTKLNTDLREIAGREGIVLPTEVSSKLRGEIDRLAKLSGAEFDREFLNEAVSDHRADLDEFQKEAASGSNKAIRDFAAGSQPTLQSHLNMALAAQSGR